jgi:prepilin-type processing-associated H-X9-DG protein
MSEPRPRIPKRAVASLVTGGLSFGMLLLAAITIFTPMTHLDMKEGLLILSALAAFLLIILTATILGADLAYSFIKGVPVHAATRVGIVLGLAALALASALTFPARERARRITCASNLKSLGLALRMYSSDWQQFPPMDGAAGLELLRSQGYLENHKMYICPSTKTLCGQGYETSLAEDIVDYVYWGGYTEADDMTIPVMLDKPDNHRAYGNALFIDGHVSGFYGKDWEAIQAEATTRHRRIVAPRREASAQ